MKYPSISVASQIARVCQDSNLHYNNTKIQKLLYCCYGCALVFLQDRLCDEYPRAWQYGPVFPKVFNHIKKGRSLVVDSLSLTGATDDAMELIEIVVKRYGVFTAQSLSAWTHEPGSPWDTVINEMGEDLGCFIPDDIITDYFSKHVIRVPENA